MKENIKINLKSEKALLIETPMELSCKVAVVIPVFNETSETLLWPLASLARQSLSKHLFEVIFVINNSRQEASLAAPEFRQNQQTIRFLRSLEAEQDLAGYFGEAALLESFNSVKNSGLRVHIIDKSSLSNAESENNVGIARDVGGSEAVLRFLKNGRKEKGLIAMLDADSYYSGAALASMVNIFEQNQINGLAGNLELVVDPLLPKNKAVKKIFLEISGYGARLEKIRKRRTAGLRLQKKHKLGYRVLATGQNIVVTAGAWVAAGGMPHYYSLEDVRFGKKIFDLPGDVASTGDYTVFTLLRPSLRAGYVSYGRVVEEIVKKIGSADFSSPVLMPRFGVINNFLEEVFYVLENGSLDAAAVEAAFYRPVLLSNGVENRHFLQNFQGGSEDFSQRPDLLTFGNIHRLTLDFLWPRLPVFDCTSVFEQALLTS